MADRIEEIKQNWNIPKRLSSELFKLAPVSASDDMKWLISEVERLRKDQKKHWQESINIYNLLIETFGKQWTDKFIEHLEDKLREVEK